MLTLDATIKVYLAVGHTDMRKGINMLSALASSIMSSELFEGALFVFRGRRSDRLKILWHDGLGFNLYYKCLDRGKFAWPSSNEQKTVGITQAQLAMLLEGIDWRMPVWSNRPEYIG